MYSCALQRLGWAGDAGNRDKGAVLSENIIASVEYVSNNGDEMSPTGKFLAYTIAFDPPNSHGHRQMARMLVASLTRTHFDGDCVIFHNSKTPIFRVLRYGVHEIYVETPDIHGLAGAEFAWSWKYRVRQWIKGGDYSKVIFLDVDSLVLRNIDHLLEGDWDIGFQPEDGLSIGQPQFACFLTDEERRGLRRNGVNSGTIAVRGAVFSEVMEEWERIDMEVPPSPRHCSDQGSWNRLLLDNERQLGERQKPRWVAKRFERGEVQFPIYLHTSYLEYRTAAILHCLGGNTREKLQFMFGMYMNNFFYDDATTMLNLLEM